MLRRLVDSQVIKNTAFEQSAYLVSKLRPKVIVSPEINARKSNLRRIVRQHRNPLTRSQSYQPKIHAKYVVKTKRYNNLAEYRVK